MGHSGLEAPRVWQPLMFPPLPSQQQKSISAMEGVMDALCKSASLFEVTVPDYKQLKACHREVRLLKELWDMIVVVRQARPCGMGLRTLHVAITERTSRYRNAAAALCIITSLPPPASLHLPLSICLPPPASLHLPPSTCLSPAPPLSCPTSLPSVSSTCHFSLNISPLLKYIYPLIFLLLPQDSLQHSSQ